MYIFTMLLEYTFLLAFSEIYSYVCFVMQISEITSTLALLNFDFASSNTDGGLLSGLVA